MSERPESQLHLWVLAAPPAIWLAHFLASYITAAIFCAKLARSSGSLGSARIAIIVYTVVALGGVIALGIRSFRRHRFGGETMPHDFDSREARDRFLGFAAFLLSLLSAVAIVYVALALALVGTCR